MVEDDVLLFVDLLGGMLIDLSVMICVGGMNVSCLVVFLFFLGGIECLLE